MDMDSESAAATTTGRCRVCLDSGVQVVALSLTVCVFAEEITFSQMLKTCCAIEISASDLKPQTMCNHCAKRAEQSFTFRKICQNSNIKLQEELDGVNINVESDRIKQEHEDDDHKNGEMATIKDEFPDYVSISNTDDTQLECKQNTSIIEQIVCKNCQTYFTDWMSLEHHLENCYARACGICWERFTSDATLNKHILTHEAPSTDEKVMLRHEKTKFHKCRFCRMSYKYPTELRNHFMTHTTVKHYLCLYCSNKFSLSHHSKCERTNSRHSHKHINRKANSKISDSLKTQPRFDCSVCKKSYRRQTTFINHKCINTTKETIPKKIHTCSHCSKEFAFASTLREHTRTHTGDKPYECSHCFKRFARPGDLNVHERIHTGEKPYECSHCRKRFARPGDLTAHERIHTGEKPYECPHCSKRFAYSSALTNHKRTHTGEKLYECSHCRKRFARPGDLAAHERIHTGQKPYECSYCSKRFTHQHQLARHKRTHTGEKPHECSDCSKRFSTQDCLTRHIRIHTGEKPYMCSHCSRPFASQSSLIRHRRIHTGE